LIPAFFFSSRRRHTRFSRDWSSDVCSSDLWFGTIPVLAQDKEITLEEIYDGTFSQQRMESLRSLNNGTEYMVVNHDRNAGTSSRSEERRVGRERRGRRRG